MHPASVFVRPLQHEEAVRLKRLSRRAKHESTRQRASVLLASNVRMPVPQIAEMWHTDPSWVRKVIHEFNERGMDSLRPRYRGGRPRRITTEQRQRIVSVAGARPDAQGIPLSRWSLPRLSDHLAVAGIEVSPRHLGAPLAEAGLSFQRTRTWKASPDPEYAEKAARILDLCAQPPTDGPVVSFDQMGPVSLRPTAGAGWAPKGRPQRQRADDKPPRRHPLRLRRPRRARRPAPGQASPETGRQRHARLHAPDPARLSRPARSGYPTPSDPSPASGRPPDNPHCCRSASDTASGQCPRRSWRHPRRPTSPSTRRSARH
jgi:transposase